MGCRVLITGCSGYLAGVLIERCVGDPDFEWVGGIDVREPRSRHGWSFHMLDVRDKALASIIRENKVDTLVHLAWIFNPTHDPELEYSVDVEGSKNVLEACRSTGVSYILYLSSTTAYGAHPDNPEAMDEEYPRRGHPKFLYSKHKAIVDELFLNFMRENPEIKVCMYRAPIVLGPNTRNFVTDIAGMRFMFGVSGYDPPMQFMHEDDMAELLYWSLKNRPVGVYNVASRGIMRYSEVARLLGKRLMRLPAWLIYPLTSMGWSLRILSFPPAVLDFIRYPWVAKTEKFTSHYPSVIKHSSEEAVRDFARARWPEKFS